MFSSFFELCNHYISGFNVYREITEVTNFFISCFVTFIFIIVLTCIGFLKAIKVLARMKQSIVISFDREILPFDRLCYGTNILVLRN